MYWNLDKLYKSFEDNKFINDFEALKKQVTIENEWAENNLNSYDKPIEKLEQALKRKNENGDLILNLFEYTNLVLSADAENTQALQNINQLEDIISEFTLSDVKFQKWVSSLNDLESIISKSEYLKEHSFYLLDLKEQNKYNLSADEEAIISKMKTTGSSSWTKLQELLTSTMKINVNGDILPLPAVRNLAYNSDVNIRKSAYEAELNAYPQIAESVAAALNGIKGEVLTVASLKGYSSVLDMTLINSRMDRQTLDSMLTAIKEYLPMFHKYFHKKGELLGHKNGLPFYDLFAPMGDCDMKFSYFDACNYIVEKFNTFSQKLGSFVDNAFKNKWIDVEPRNGKRGGAFCCNIHSIKESRILTNFTGSYSDVVTLAHELGHAYHGDCLKNEQYLNSDYPMPIAETASTFCETVINQATLKTANNDEAFSILESTISDAAQVVVDILSRYIFEDTVFSRRKFGFLSADELCQIMLDAQTEAYSYGLDKEYMHKYMWLCKPHYYDAEYNYYNFPYAFGLLFAKGLYSSCLDNPVDFINRYDLILTSTGSKNLYDVAQMANIDIHSVDFWRSSLDILKKDIEKFIDLADKKLK